jgi:hypothetical protein
MSSGEFQFQDELASLFTQRPGPGMPQLQQEPASGSWFADYLQAATPMPMDYDLLYRALELPVAEDVVKKEMVLETAGGGAPLTPSTGGGTPNATSSMSSSSSEAGVGGGGAGDQGDSAGRLCKKEEGQGEDGKGGDDDGDKSKKG